MDPSFNPSKQSNSHKQSNLSETTVHSNSEEMAPLHSTPSYSSSSVKVSSPLSKPPWNFQDEEDQSHWIHRRWSTLSNASVLQRQRKKLTNSQLWLRRQKRKTFPPALEAYDRKKTESEITGFFYQQPPNEISDSHPSVSSSSVSKKLGRLLKKKGKQPYRQKKKPGLTIDTSFTDLNLSTLELSELPPTISSDSTVSTPIPVNFPTPPDRFSAHFIDLNGHVGRVEYSRSGQSSSWLKDLFRYGPCPYEASFLPMQRLTQEEFERYSKMLSFDTILFLFGFLLFPLWWIGFGLFLYRKHKGQDGSIQFAAYHELYSVRTIGFLNGAFSLFSIILAVVTIVLMAWLLKDW
ncbi:hypothetical protein BD560DRAFT_393703 [Blakeslea trispora]|nr:hypothetical protein BD560DRAFT_393703 [Blakeslea trispora]